MKFFLVSVSATLQNRLYFTVDNNNANTINKWDQEKSNTKIEKYNGSHRLKESVNFSIQEKFGKVKRNCMICEITKLIMRSYTCTYIYE